MKYLIFAFLLSVAAGLGVYQVLKERRAEAAASEASRPKPPPRPAHTRAPAPEPEETAEPTESPPHEPRDPLAREAVCDEVSCVLGKHSSSECCEKFLRRRPAASDKLESLDRAAIADGIAKIKGQIMACGETSDATGLVKVRVKVDTTGKVTMVQVADAPDEDLGKCVARVMKKASFAETETGGSFSYPFVF